ncbi:unnamed protein product, partial [Anisakis simplex]|uniref:Ovule protein n=1 Tax=Anisakis simplex TaxID=6269 RepID=A0A0M3JQ50_ANISI
MPQKKGVTPIHNGEPDMENDSLAKTTVKPERNDESDKRMMMPENKNVSPIEKDKLHEENNYGRTRSDSDGGLSEGVIVSASSQPDLVTVKRNVANSDQKISVDSRANGRSSKLHDHATDTNEGEAEVSKMRTE